MRSTAQLLFHLPARGRPPTAPCRLAPSPVQVHAVHRFEPAVLDHAAMLGLGLRHVIKFVVCHLEDERVRRRGLGTSL